MLKMLTLRPGIGTEKNQDQQILDRNKTSPVATTGKLILSILERYRLPNAKAEHKSLDVGHKFLAQVE